MKKIIWMAGADQQRVIPPWFLAWLLGGQDEVIVKPTPVLGLDPGVLEERLEILWGLPVFPRDDDLRLRRLPQEMEVSADPHHSRIHIRKPTFARLIAEKFCADCTTGKDRGEPIYVSYH